jgi:hypothetical protein
MTWFVCISRPNRMSLYSLCHVNAAGCDGESKARREPQSVARSVILYYCYRIIRNLYTDNTNMQKFAYN